jgi:hypothetical protein
MSRQLAYFVGVVPTAHKNKTACGRHGWYEYHVLYSSYSSKPARRVGSASGWIAPLPPQLLAELLHGLLLSLHLSLQLQLRNLGAVLRFV